MLYSLFAMWIFIFWAGYKQQSRWRSKLWWLIPVLIAYTYFIFANTNFNLHYIPYGITYHAKPTCMYMQTLLCISTGLGFYLTITDPKLIIGICATIMGITQILATQDWFNLYIGFEITLIGVILTGFILKWSDLRKYFRNQLLSTTLILLGVVQSYAYNGNMIMQSKGQVLFILGIMMKIGMWPFQFGLRFYNTMPKSMYLLITVITSKIALYCLAITTNILYIRWIAVSSLIASIGMGFMGKNLKELQNCIILGSYSTMLVLILDAPMLIQVLYLSYSVLIQILFSNLHTRILSFIIAYMPIIGIGFWVKIMILHNSKDMFFRILLIIQNLVLTIKILKVIIKILSRFYATKFKKVYIRHQ